jgi:hypothetical protein
MPKADHTGWLWIKGKPVEIHLTNPGDYDVTDAAGLPDGGLLVLERRFPWSEGVKSRLRLVRTATSSSRASASRVKCSLTPPWPRRSNNMGGPRRLGRRGHRHHDLGR